MLHLLLATLSMRREGKLEEGRIGSLYHRDSFNMHIAHWAEHVPGAEGMGMGMG